MLYGVLTVLYCVLTGVVSKGDDIYSDRQEWQILRVFPPFHLEHPVILIPYFEQTSILFNPPFPFVEDKKRPWSNRDDWVEWGKMTLVDTKVEVKY
jgi:hypothetical protein